MDMLEYVERVGSTLRQFNILRSICHLILSWYCFLLINLSLLLLKVEKLKEITVREIARMPTYFVPGNLN